jgi:HSP20 family molecular chaperone IbpA
MFYPYIYTDALLDRMFEVDTKYNKLRFVDKGDFYSLTTPLTGARKEDVHVLVKEDTQLTISYNPKEKNPYTPSFTNKWSLEGVDTDNIVVSLNNGLLTVVLPKSKPAQPKVRTIEVI